MTNACKRLLNINISPSPPGGLLRKRPLQMYKKIRMEKVMWIRNFLNTGYFALFFPFAGRNALVLTSYKKEEWSPNFGHETGLKQQKPGRKTSAYIFIFLSGSFWAHWRLFFKNLCSFRSSCFLKGCFYNILNSYPSSFRNSMARGSAYCRLPLFQDFSESWKVMMEPLRT